MLKNYINFFYEFVSKPGVIGAVAPSSTQLANRMVEWLDFEQINVVVEYGCGTGVFTSEILKRIKPKTTFFALEINENLVEQCHKNVPSATVYNDSVVNISKYLDKHKVNKVDAIISGLPWAAFSKELQDSLMQETLKVLVDGGKFATFAYVNGLVLPPAIRFRKKLRESFSTIEHSPIVWYNLPPAFVYRCKK